MPDTLFRQSLLNGHTLKVEHGQAIPREAHYLPVWIFGTILLLTGLLCLYYRLRKIKALDLLKSLIDIRALDRLVRDCNLNRSITLLPIGLLLVGALGLPLHHLLWPASGLGGYMLMVGVLGLLYILRNWLIRLLGNIFDNRNGVVSYITSNYLYHLVEATAVTLLLLPYFYIPGLQRVLLAVLVGVIAIAFLCRFVRGMKVFLTHPNSSSFYLFYYLCIVELIPILVIIRGYIAQ